MITKIIIQIKSTKCQYQHNIFIFVLFDINIDDFFIIIYMIIIVPIKTCDM